MSLLVLQDINGTQCYDVTCQVTWIIQIFFCYCCFFLIIYTIKQSQPKFKGKVPPKHLNPHSLLTGSDSCDICLHFHNLWLQQLMQLCYSLKLPLISRCNITPAVLRCNIQYRKIKQQPLSPDPIPVLELYKRAVLQRLPRKPDRLGMHCKTSK